MKRSKAFISIFLVIALSVAFAACSRGGSSSQGYVTAAMDTTAPSYKGEAVNISIPAGSLGMGMVKLFDSKIFNVSVSKSEDEYKDLFGAGKVDIAVCSTQKAISLCSESNGALKILAVTSLCCQYVLSTDAQIKSIKDLENKKLCCIASDSENDGSYIFDALFEKSGLSGRVELIKCESIEKVLEALSSGNADAALLSEPEASIAINSDNNLEVRISVEKAWDILSPDSKLAEGCLVVSSAFAEKNPEAVEQFIVSAKDSVEYVNISGKDALNQMVSKGIISENVVFSSDKKDDKDKIEQYPINTIRRSNVVFITGEEMKSYVEAASSLVDGQSNVISPEIFYSDK